MHLLLAGIALTCVVAQLSCGPEESRTGECGASAPAGPVPLAKDFDIDDCRGKVVVLNFWATWCGPCRIEIPALVRLRHDFDADEVAFVGISTSERGTEQQVLTNLKAFIEREEINYPIYYDSDMEVMRHFDERAGFSPYIPATLIFDQEGELRATHRGVPPDAAGRPNPYAVLGEQIQFLLDNT